MLNEKRLDRISENLTPKQAILVWLQQANIHANVADYVKSLVGQPEELRPITLLTAHMASATRVAMKGQSPKAIELAVRRAERDVVFLMKLHHKVNFYFITEERVWFAAFAALEAKLRAITYGNALRQLVKEIAVERREDVSWRLIAEAYLTQMYAFRQATAIISRSYFDGEELLFSEYTQSLSELIGYIETLVEAFNEDVAKKPREKMKLEMLRKNSEQAARER